MELREAGIRIPILVLGWTDPRQASVFCDYDILQSGLNLEYVRELSDQMVRYLCNFARSGDPNEAGLPAWLPVSGNQSKSIRFGEGNIRMEQPGMLKMVKTMFTNKAVGE